MNARSVSTSRFSKPQEARELEARARAKRLGVRVAVLVEASRYCTNSQSQPGTVHTMQRTRAGWVCTCEGYVQTGCCKHLGAVERRAEREGWDFGSICPLHRAPKYFPLDDAPSPSAPANVSPFRTIPNARRDSFAADLYGA